MKNAFLLRDDIIFLNHGSFGACPREVFGDYRQWQERVESQPVLLLGRQIVDLLAEARAALGAYLGAHPDDLVYVPNSTHGVNIVAHSLSFSPGDEILATDHEYGACSRMWEALCKHSGATYIQQEIPLYCESQQELVERIWSGVTPRTKLLFISHITSPTAMHLPVAELCRRAREQGILTLVDGSHGPALLDFSLEELGADFYTGNCHKWMCSPKGAGFLYAERSKQHLIEPLVISWGDEATVITGNRFLDEFQWTGTSDPSAYLSVPAAISFMQSNNWHDVRSRCRELAQVTKNRLCELPGIQPLYPDNNDMYFQFFAVALPPCDVAEVKQRLYDEFNIEVVVMEMNSQPLLRVSVQAYNTPQDMDALIDALPRVLPH